MATQPTQPTDRSLSGVFDERDTLLLKQAVEKLVRFGQQVGVTPEEMISLLDSGINYARPPRIPSRKGVRSRIVSPRRS